MSALVITLGIQKNEKKAESHLVFFQLFTKQLLAGMDAIAFVVLVAVVSLPAVTKLNGTINLERKRPRLHLRAHTFFYSLYCYTVLISY